MAKSIHIKNPWVVVILVLFALPFTAIGGWMGSQLVSTIARYRAVQQWDEVPAKIIRAEWKNEDTGEGMTCWVETEYQYEYQGKRYRGRRVSLHGGSDNIGDFWSKVYGELSACLRTGRPMHCYVNPARPSQTMLYRGLRWEMVVFQSFLTLVLGGAGVVMLIAAPIGFFAMRRQLRLEQAHPDEPWFWRTDWAIGEIKYPCKPHFLGAIGAALAWNSIAIPLGLLALNDVIGGHNMIAFLAMILPAIGLALILRPVILFLQWLKYGQSTLKMVVPGVIGGKLSGVVRTAVKVRSSEGFRVTLACWQTDRSGAEAARKVFWQDEQIIANELLPYDTAQLAIPVAFHIPFDCGPTGGPCDTTWKLDVRAVAVGVGYHAKFDVPVFRTPESDPNLVPDQGTIAKYVARPDPDRDLREAGVVKTASRTDDGCRFVFSGWRSYGHQSRWGTLLAVACFVACTGAAVFRLRAHQPIDVIAVEVIPLLLFDSLIVLFLLKFAFYRSVVGVSSRGVAVKAGPFGLGRRRWIPASAIARLEAVSPTWSTTCRNLVVVCQDGEQVTLGKWLRSRRLADSVLRQIEEVMSGQPPVPSPPAM